MRSFIPILFFLPLPIAAQPLAGAPACTTGEVRTFEGIPFVRICGGTFTMGSANDDPVAFPGEKPAHTVRLSEFWIGQTEVTNAAYWRLVPEHRSSRWCGEDDCPVGMVSWTDAAAFCAKYGFRLPSEAEWEYVARAGTSTRWPFADDESRVGEYAWTKESSDNKPQPVAGKKPNPWGVYDLYGNLIEWVQDCYVRKAYTSREGVTVDPVVVSGCDPIGTTIFRVWRGGMIYTPARKMRPAVRSRMTPEFEDDHVGFRCALGAAGPDPRAD